MVRQARFAGAFTFQYSKRPGTPAESMEDQVPRDVVQDRYERLVALQDEMAWDENKRIVGRTVEVLVAEGRGARTPPPTASAAAHATTGSSTSRCLRRSRRRGLAMWSRSRSRTPRPIT